MGLGAIVVTVGVGRLMDCELPVVSFAPTIIGLIVTCLSSIGYMVFSLKTLEGLALGGLSHYNVS